MALNTSIDKANAGDPVVRAWFEWGFENHAACEARFPYPTCNIIASEQMFMKSASEGRCYMCGHKTDHRQTTGICFPPVAKSAWICAECDAE